MKLKAIRERLKITQAEAAMKCDVSITTIMRIEQNPEYKPSGRIMKKLCKGLKCKLEELEV